ncbi:MAG: hypothetical protein GKS02_06550 [Alphaproteobacteria bacterium]|nr:hypothetical protein [Alphaproteobacteria bacterium]
MKNHFKWIFIAPVVALLSIAISGPALADHEMGHDEVARGGILALEQRIWDLEQLLINQPSEPGPVTVDCAAGELVQDALDIGATDITVTGTCNENVSISNDNVVLDGSGTASLIGDGLSTAMAITADHVVIKDWASVEGGAGIGITVGSGGSATISNMASITGSRGLNVTESAFANIIGSSFSNGPGDGLFATLGGNVTIQGSSFSGNSLRGILITNTGSVSLKSDNVIDGNTRQGVLIINGALTIQRNVVNNSMAGNGTTVGQTDLGCFSYSRIFVGASFTNTGGTSNLITCDLGNIGFPLFNP